MKFSSLPRTTLASGSALLLGFAALKLFIHFYTNAFAGYGIFRDELYYMACSEHLSAGYVDQPPLSIFFLAVIRLVFGKSLFAIRLLPAICGAVTVYLTGVLARELGGGKSAQLLASIASIVSLALLAMGTIYSMNIFDVLFWTWSMYILVLLLKTGDKKHWLSLGFVLGIGLLNKISVLWLGFGILSGMLLTPERRWLKTEYPYVAALLAFALFFPFIIWNSTHNFAHLEFIRNASSEKYSSLSPITFLIGQVIVQNPVTLPLWISGIVWLLFSKDEKRFRLLGYLYLTALLVLILNGHSKAEYLSQAYPILFAAGGVGVERWTSRRSLRVVRPLYAALLACGVFLAPVVLPILPVETYIRYADRLGITPSTAEAKQLDQLPQFYADMFGWEEKAAAVAKVFHSLTPEEQSKCAIFGDNYGRCAAIDFYAKKYNLPKSIGSHNSYWVWGPRRYTGDIVIVLGGRVEDKQQIFDSVAVGGTVSSQYCMPYENNLSIYVCRKLHVPLKEFWTKLRHYD